MADEARGANQKNLGKINQEDIQSWYAHLPAMI
jgi:hypothetical protein